MLTIYLLVKFQSHLPQLYFLFMNGGDGTKISEECESSDENLAYDDDKLRVCQAH